MDRWIYSLTPREVKGDDDALVCVVNNSKHLSREECTFCPIKHLSTLFEDAHEAENARDNGKKVESRPFMDPQKFEKCLTTIISLTPKMWKKIGSGDTEYECILPEGITKENLAECCKAYNKHKGLKCEFDNTLEKKDNNMAFLQCCPCCGEAAIIRPTEYLGGEGFYIECPECGMRTSTNSTKEDVLEIWNRRDGVAL